MMLNNMLGEEDLNPKGFHAWPADTRMSSMMAPTMFIEPSGILTALGSGGSNRIRTAILQVLLNLLDFSMGLSDAVEAPRANFEQGLLSLESGFEEAVIAALKNSWPEFKAWDERNLFLWRPCRSLGQHNWRASRRR